MTHSWDHFLRDLAGVSRKATLAVLEHYRRGPTLGGDVALKEGGEVQLPVDRLASAAGITEMKLRFNWPYVDEEVDSTHLLLDQRTGKPFLLSDWLDGSGAFELDTLLPTNANSAGFGNTFGILVDGAVKAGIMVQPARKQLFYGAEGGGCHWLMGRDFDEFLATGDLARGTVLQRDPNEEPVDAKHPLTITFPQGSKMSKLDLAAFCAARMQLADRQLFGNEKAEGCAVGNCALVMMRQSAAYLNYGGGMAWDLAIPMFLAELSGCVAKTIAGEHIVWGKAKQKVILARDQRTMTRLLEAL